jgi:hypothetical protein
MELERRAAIRTYWLSTKKLRGHGGFFNNCDVLYYAADKYQEDHRNTVSHRVLKYSNYWEVRDGFDLQDLSRVYACGGGEWVCGGWAVRHTLARR